MAWRTTVQFIESNLEKIKKKNTTLSLEAGKIIRCQSEGVGGVQPGAVGFQLHYVFQLHLVAAVCREVRSSEEGTALDRLDDEKAEEAHLRRPSEAELQTRSEGAEGLAVDLKE